jgi:hypothetical protein
VAIFVIVENVSVAVYISHHPEAKRHR